MSSVDNKRLNKIVRALEAGINTALAMDPIAQKHLKRMKSCILEINLSSPNRVFYAGVEEKKDVNTEQQASYQVKLLSAQEHSDVQIKGSLLSFIKLAATSDKNTLIRTKELLISGDSVRIQQVQAFLTTIKVDWEGILSSVIGDVPAHLIGTSLRQGLSFGLNLGQSLLRDAEEFIKYELRLFPNRIVAQKQFAAIDKLQEASNLLENRIKARLNKGRKEKALTGNVQETDHPPERD